MFYISRLDSSTFGYFDFYVGFYVGGGGGGWWVVSGVHLLRWSGLGMRWLPHV